MMTRILHCSALTEKVIYKIFEIKNEKASSHIMKDLCLAKFEINQV